MMIAQLQLLQSGAGCGQPRPMAGYGSRPWPAKRQRAGTVPLRVSPSGRLSVMLIESRRHADRWTLPAGGVERGERGEQAALRETKEEAGLVRLKEKLAKPKARKDSDDTNFLAVPDLS